MRIPAIGATRIALAACVAFTAAVISGPSLAAAKIQHLVTPGGLQAWFVQDATVPLISMEYSFGGGASQDPADKPGVGHMVANLIDEGSGDMDSATFHDRLERRAIQLSYAVTRDYFRGSLRMLKDDRDEAFGLLHTSLTQPRFEPKDVERIRAQLMSTLRRESLDPNTAASRKFLQVAFGDHPYGRPPTGTLESLPKITIDDMKTYVSHVLAKDTLKIAVVGDIDADSLAKLLDSTFGSLPAHAQLTPVPEVVATKPPQRSFVPLDVPQTVVMFGGPGLKRHDPDFMAGYLVNHILGGGSLSSRLYREVREKRGLAYSIYEQLLWMEHSALFIGATGTRADRATDSIEAITAEVKRMADQGPTQAELDQAKSYINGSQMLSLDTSAKLAQALLQYQNDGMPIDYIEKRSEVVNAVTLDDAKRAARRLWSNGLLTVIVGRQPQAAASPNAVKPAGEPPQPRAN